MCYRTPVQTRRLTVGMSSNHLAFLAYIGQANGRCLPGIHSPLVVGEAPELVTVDEEIPELVIVDG